MPKRHPNELLGNVLHATLPPTQHTNQWTKVQWHQSLIWNSRHVMNHSTLFIIQVACCPAFSMHTTAW